MKYLNITRNIAFIAMISLVFIACKKVKVATPMGDAGQTLVKLLGGGTPAAISSKPIDFVNTPTKILAVEIRRDVPNETELNKTMVVTVKDDTAAVTTAGKLQLSTAWYTVDPVAGVVKTGGQGGTFTVTFQPGEFSKSIFVIVPDATLLDPSLLYGLGFTVMTADAGGVLSTQKSVVIEIGAKNPYDGIYSIEAGSMVTRYTGPGTIDNSNPALNGSLVGNDDIILSTIGAFTVSIPPSTPAVPGRLLWAFGANSAVSGIDGVKITVNPVTNLVNSVSTGFAGSNATFGNWPGHVNDYNPSTKTFRLAWKWTVSPPPPYREYEMVLKYKGPR